MKLFIRLAAFLSILDGKRGSNRFGDHSHGNNGDNHLPAPDLKECDVEYLFSESGTETERCSDGKDFFYTDRYMNETFCSNSAEIDREKCWWDTSIESNCIESSECVWLTNRVEQGMCYCSHADTCSACKPQTPAPTINKAYSLCPDKCEVYYLGCVGMYCKCWGECTSSAEAGCSEPVNAGCHSYFGEETQGDREDGEGDVIPDEINSGNDENDWLHDLISGQWLHDLINQEEDESEEDDDNDWTWPWFSEEDESEEDESEEDDDKKWPWSGWFGW